MNMQKTPNEWREIVKRWKESTDTQRSFCKKNKIPTSTFRYWLIRYDEDYSNDELVKITMPNSSRTSANYIYIKSSSCTIRIPDTESEQNLLTLFRALKAVNQ